MHTGDKVFECPICLKKFTRKENLQHHLKVTTHEKRASDSNNPRPSKRAKKNNKVLDVFSTEMFFPSEKVSGDLLKFLDEVRPRLYEKLEEELTTSAVKWYAVINLEMMRMGADGEDEKIETHFRSKCAVELMAHTISPHIEESFEKISKSFEEFTQRGSGWSLEKIISMELYTAVYKPLAASSYIPTPKHLEMKKAILNIQNEDHKCLLWCLLAHKKNIPREQIPRRVSHYTAFENLFDMKNVDFPVPITQIPLIEKMNNLRINVFGYEEKEVFPLHISDREDMECINLLLISEEGGNRHYCLIQNMSRLLGDLTRHEHRRFYCERCLHRFSEERLLQDHSVYCKKYAPQVLKMPKLDESTLEFKNINFQHPVPYIIYADFEALIRPLPSALPNPSTSSSTKISQHEACGYAYVVVGPNGKTFKPICVYRGVDAVDHFLKEITKVERELSPKLLDVKPLKMTNQEEASFRNATHCTICKKALGSDRVKDHDHITGRFRSAVHNRCNLQFKMRKMIPVVFHNLKHYDAHHIMQGLGKLEEYECQVIAINMEKYISFSLSREHEGVRVSLQFIDSLQFMPSSLEKLVGNLNHNDFKIMGENIPRHTDLLLRKGVYPYEYIDCFSKFSETCLPPIEAFYSSLSDEGITAEDYAHAQAVWKTFGLNNLGEYHDLYVKADVLQLADVFQSFRGLCKSYYDLDCAHMMTAPGLAWQACLKMCEQPLELLTDVDMHLFIERGIRGGIAMISKRWAEANNKDLDHFDASKPSNYIVYLDANNLYAWSMIQTLPYADFKWANPEEYTEESILSTPDDSARGFILEVDLSLPTHLHEYFNDYPPAPERVTITEDLISSFSHNLLKNSHFIKTEKLTPNLNSKKNYVIHYRNLKLYLALGVKLDKIHKVLTFKQKAWMKPYIDFNTEKRKNAQNQFEKDFFKLMNNSVYGKTMENVRKRKDIKLVNSVRKSEKMVAAPSFHGFKIFNENLVGVERVQKSILLNRPIYVGFVILELSKVLMYDFHYNHIKKRYGSNAELLFTDTDSLMYNVYTEDIYKDMAEHLHLFDTSDYPRHHPLHSNINKKRIGCFKDELNGKLIHEFIGLRAKMYSILSEEGEKKTAKGVSRSIIKKKIKHKNYKECLMRHTVEREYQTRIQSESHRLYTAKLNKVTLSAFDDKRYVLDDGVHTLAHGHFKINNNNNE